MGASESSLTSSRNPDDGITTVSERAQSVDPILEKLQFLEITKPILTSAPTESSLTDILVRRPFSSSATGTVNPNVLLELFSIYRDWQEKKAEKIIKRQEEVENKIEVADALAVKLLQRYNYSVSAMKTTANHLSEVHALQVGLGELKGRLTEVISNCDALCKRIIAEEPESLQSSVKPFTDSCTNQSSTISMSTALPSTEEKGSSSDQKKNSDGLNSSPSMEEESSSSGQKNTDGLISLPSMEEEVSSSDQKNTDGLMSLPSTEEDGHTPHQ